WQGKSCEKDVEECMTSPCYNAGICINTPGSFACACQFGYTGYLCEDTLVFCEDSPCENDALCVMEDHNATCYCVPDYHGSKCQHQYNDCLPYAPRCMNGGVCIDGIDSFLCSCPDSTYGILCQCVRTPDGIACEDLPDWYEAKPYQPLGGAEGDIYHHWFNISYPKEKTTAPPEYDLPVSTTATDDIIYSTSVPVFDVPESSIISPGDAFRTSVFPTIQITSTDVYTESSVISAKDLPSVSPTLFASVPYYVDDFTTSIFPSPSFFPTSMTRSEFFTVEPTPVLPDLASTTLSEEDLTSIIPDSIPTSPSLFLDATYVLEDSYSTVSPELLSLSLIPDYEVSTLPFFQSSLFLEPTPVLSIATSVVEPASSVFLEAIPSPVVPVFDNFSYAPEVDIYANESLTEAIDNQTITDEYIINATFPYTTDESKTTKDLENETTTVPEITTNVSEVVSESTIATITYTAIDRINVTDTYFPQPIDDILKDPNVTEKSVTENITAVTSNITDIISASTLPSVDNETTTDITAIFSKVSTEVALVTPYNISLVDDSENITDATVAETADNFTVTDIVEYEGYNVTLTTEGDDYNTTLTVPPDLISTPVYYPTDLSNVTEQITDYFSTTDVHKQVSENVTIAFPDSSTVYSPTSTDIKFINASYYFTNSTLESTITTYLNITESSTATSIISEAVSEDIYKYNVTQITDSTEYTVTHPNDFTTAISVLTPVITRQNETSVPATPELNASIADLTTALTVSYIFTDISTNTTEVFKTSESTVTDSTTYLFANDTSSTALTLPYAYTPKTNISHTSIPADLQTPEMTFTFSVLPTKYSGFTENQTIISTVTAIGDLQTVSLSPPTDVSRNVTIPDDKFLYNTTIDRVDSPLPKSTTTIATVKPETTDLGTTELMLILPTEYNTTTGKVYGIGYHTSTTPFSITSLYPDATLQVPEIIKPDDHKVPTGSPSDIQTDQAGSPSKKDPVFHTTPLPALATKPASVLPGMGEGTLEDQAPASVCGSAYCLNGGTCVTIEDKSMCQCTFNYKGSYCELYFYIHKPYFVGASYLGVDVGEMSMRQGVQIYVQFTSQSPNGLVAYSEGPGDAFFMLLLRNSLLQFVFSCGLQTVSFLQGNEKLSRNYRTDVSVRLWWTPYMLDLPWGTGKCSASLQINGTSPIYSEQRSSSPSVVLGLLYLGGLPSSYSSPLVVKAGFLPRLHGCVSLLEVNGIEVDTWVSAVSGEGIQECGSALCPPGSCRNGGSCVPGPAFWSCICPPGYHGELCERGDCKRDDGCYSGKCVPSDKDSPLCLCPQHKHGLYCELERVVERPSYSGTVRGYSSYSVYRMEHDTTHSLAFKLHFTTEALRQIGLLAYLGNTVRSACQDFLALSLVRGHLMLTWDLGAGPRRIITPEPLDTSLHTHTALIGRRGKHAWLVADFQANVSGIAPGYLSSLNTNNLLYIGKQALLYKCQFKYYVRGKRRLKNDKR
ncbi:hypothetical protein SK128_010504, partial [Halocaridina rubra]